jgi:hypothetical protein
LLLVCCICTSSLSNIVFFVVLYTLHLWFHLQFFSIF